MKNTLFVVLMLLSINAVAQTGDKNFIDQNYIEVVGKSELQISPDQIYIKIVLKEEDTKNKEGLAELENKLITTLEEIGINVEKDLLIKDINSNFKYYLLSKSKILLSKEYEVLVRDGKTASRVFLGLENIGISNVSIDRLEHSEMVKFRKEVKVNAVKAAKDKAEALASALGQDIGRALYIEEMNDPFHRPMISNSMMVRGLSSDVYGANKVTKELDFDFEKIKISYSILCRFELK